MVDNNMSIINLKINDIKNLECNYGLNNNVINVTDIIKNILNDKINNKIYFIKIKVNNNLVKKDPILGKKKNLYIKLANNNFKIEENKILFFNIKLFFNIIFKDNIANAELNKYNYATIFGKGPTFKVIDKKDNELRCAINQASNIAKDVDLLCMNDHHNLFKIELDTYKNLKYILIPEYLHIKEVFNKKGYFGNILNYLDGKFFGSLIIYNLITSKVKTPYFINLNTGISSGNTIYEFLCRYTNVSKINLFY